MPMLFCTNTTLQVHKLFGNGYWDYVGMKPKLPQEIKTRDLNSLHFFFQLSEATYKILGFCNAFDTWNYSLFIFESNLKMWRCKWMILHFGYLNWYFNFSDIEI